MPEGGVDLLETVKVEIHDCTNMRLAPGLGQHVAEPFDQGRTVVKPGQRIVLGQIADACLLPLAFGQLAQRHQQI